MSVSKRQNFNFNKLKDDALSKIEDILDRLNIEHTVRGPERINILCPVHKSEDFSSACIYLSNGAFKCWSRSCDNEIGKNFVHLIRWRLSEDKEYYASWDDVRNLIESKDLRVVHYEKIKRENKIEPMDKSKYPSITIPSKYYIERGFSPEILKTFFIGDTEQFPYSGRSVIPVHSPTGELMGFTARSIHDKCTKCSYYHSRYQSCIDKKYEYASMFHKWFHSKGLRKTLTLYNIHNVEGPKVCIVEGPSCVWRLKEFEIPAVATLGKSISDYQIELLKSKGITSVLFVPDNDEAGNEFKTKFIQQFSGQLKIFIVNLPKKDISEMTNEEIESVILKKWAKI